MASQPTIFVLNHVHKHIGIMSVNPVVAPIVGHGC
jgi:hypothetical protein